MNKFSQVTIPAWGWALLPFLVGVLVFCNTLGQGFVYDDVIFHDVPSYHSLSGIPAAFRLPFDPGNSLSGAYRPLTVVTFILNFGLFGESAFSFHLVNILLHGFICTLIFLLLTKTLKFDRVTSLSLALIFAVLPIHSEVVANIKSRDELLGMMFFILMWMTFEMGKKKSYWYGVSGGLFLIALLSKETAVLYPVIIGVWSWIRYRRVLPLLWFIPGLIIYGAMRMSVPGASIGFQQSTVAFIANPLFSVSWPVRVWSGLSILTIYLVKIFFPITLSASYHYAHFTPLTDPLHTLTWIPGLISIVGMLFFAWRHARMKDGVLLGLVLSIILYIPISQILFPVNDVMAERWMYGPSLGILMVGMFTLFPLMKKKQLLVSGTILMLTFGYGVRTLIRNTVWQSNKTLYLSMVRDAPQSAKGHELLARELVNEKDYENANKQADVAATIFSSTGTLQNLYAVILLAQGHYSEAEKHLLESQNINPESRETQRLLGAVLYLEKKYDLAYEHLVPIMENNQSVTFQEKFTYIPLLLKLKRYKESATWLQGLSLEDQSRLQAKYFKAVYLYKTGSYDEATRISWDLNLTEEQRIQAMERF